MNSMQELFCVVEEVGRKQLQKQLMHYVARCYRVAQRCHEDLTGWQQGREMQELQARQQAAQARQQSQHQFQQWMAEQEALYAAGQVPGLPDDTTEDERSELVPCSMSGASRQQSAGEEVEQQRA
jgi:hypothetical protein